MPKISIIVPVYNTEKYLKKCLDSLVTQTLRNIEILVVNDGSTDESEKIILEYQKRFPDIIKYLKKDNGGLSDARNFAIPYTSGKYIGFVDSDDYVDKNMFETMYNLAENNNSDLIECNFIWEYPNKSKIDFGFNCSNKQDYFVYGRVMVCNKLFKADIIKKYNIKFPLGLRYEDIEFFYKLIPFINNYTLITTTFYHYTQRDTSIINKQNNKNEDIFIILNNILDFYKINNMYNEYSLYLEYLYIRFLLGSSFLRIVKIKDKTIRKNLLKKSINELYFKFPNWQKNKLLKIKSKKNIYYKTINKFTFKIYSFIFQFI